MLLESIFVRIGQAVIFDLGIAKIDQQANLLTSSDARGV